MQSPLKVAAAVLLFVPIVAFAQSTNTPTNTPTREQVREHLVELEKAGYNPYETNWLYPNSLQSAQARVAYQSALKNDAYGPSSSGTSDTGR